LSWALPTLGQTVGDFGPLQKPTWRESSHEIQIIHFKPTVRDFREAPPQSQPKPPDAQESQPAKQLNDPDSSPETKVAWDEWHKRVADAILQRFSPLANAAFYRSKLLCAVATYTVTRDGRIMNAHLVQENANAVFNAIVLNAINSLNDNSNKEILQFPAGSKKEQVEESQTFQFSEVFIPRSYMLLVNWFDCATQKNAR